MTKCHAPRTAPAAQAKTDACLLSVEPTQTLGGRRAVRYAPTERRTGFNRRTGDRTPSVYLTHPGRLSVSLNPVMRIR